MIAISMILLLTTITKGTDGTTVYIDPSSKTVELNQTFMLNVSVSNVINLYGFEFNLTYDTSILDATNVANGSFLNPLTFEFKKEINDTVGYVWYGVSSLPPADPANGSGTLATVTFKATGVGNTTLRFDKSILSNSSIPSQPIPHSKINGTVTVQQSSIPVGGVHIPVNKLQLLVHWLAPYIGLALVLITAVVAVVYIKHKKEKD